VFQEYLILVRCLGLPLPVPVGSDVEQLVVVLARALWVRALGDVHVDHSDHGGAVARLTVHSIREVTHVVDLNERLDVYLEFVHVLLD
jgi:hypothetical protein